MAHHFYTQLIVHANDILSYLSEIGHYSKTMYNKIFV
jgi:hypothetical protein